MKKLIYFPNYLGQKKKVESMYTSCWNKYLKYNKIQEIKLIDNNNLKSNINQLYNFLKKGDYEKTLLIGGDHSTSISSLAYTSNKYENLKVLWIDAHPDINTYDKSQTKNQHGMVLSFLTGMDNGYKNIINKYIKKENILYIGIRDIDNFEQQVINENNIKYITCEKLNSNPIKELVKIKKFIQNDPVHISLDVDSIDPKYIPCTGTPIKNGLKINILYNLLEKLLKNRNIVHIDLMEINFSLGNIIEKWTTFKNINPFIKLFKS